MIVYIRLYQKINDSEVTRYIGIIKEFDSIKAALSYVLDYYVLDDILKISIGEVEKEE